jgi:type VI secretion system protein ImpA
VDGLRRAPLVASRVHGIFSLRDLEIAAGQTAPRDGEARPSEQQINSAFAEMSIEDLVRLHSGAQQAMAALKTMDAQMREAAGSDAAPYFDPLSAQLVKIERAVGAQIALRPGQAAAGAGVSVEAAGSVPGAIRSRQDAMAALDAVAEFFRRTEPSSPIPLFLSRAKRLVSKDFLEVLADIAPDAVAQARVAGGLRDGE